MAPRRFLQLAAVLAVGLAVPAVHAGGPEDGGVTARPALRLSALSLDAAGIRAVLSHHLPELQACYEQVLVDGGRAEGAVLARFTVTGQGKVKEASVEEQGGELGSPAVCRCLEQQLRDMSFPRPADGLDQPVETPINLKAVE
ncbi:MAG: AgmX/PglI C-terminal domain-containing protein [Deltaproteobacteria bacterium]|nr:AgmX/PglI C-terminal domain-containing protein [Deltaproteobacteria bacterium]